MENITGSLLVINIIRFSCLDFKTIKSLVLRKLRKYGKFKKTLCEKSSHCFNTLGKRDKSYNFHLLIVAMENGL